MSQNIYANAVALPEWTSDLTLTVGGVTLELRRSFDGAYTTWEVWSYRADAPGSDEWVLSTFGKYTAISEAEKFARENLV